ncbi:class I SAM-dependent methyltransferase [Facilibium subflavum]|uniref:class I SAM-dependent methyltransferase n=1 Tax=Facilibium subflavum TaxID=2219058 RepID=UPI000E65BF58|nr:class I SAM-dependent methyltransferase [Facilibium subflavum]
MITIYTTTKAQQQFLADLLEGENIAYTLVTTAPDNGFFLGFKDDKLTLFLANSPLSLNVDFTSQDIQQRINPQTAKPGIIKAVEGKKKKALHILDMTAGLGTDSFTLAARGHTVISIEENPYVFCLLKDGLFRANKNPQLTHIAEKITIVNQNAIIHTKEMTTTFDIIYLDPMFPSRKKSAKVKKNMQLLHQLVQTSPDNDTMLFEQAKKLPHAKIIVKRPRHSDFLGQKTPTSQIIGKANRFDIYA